MKTRHFNATGAAVSLLIASGSVLAVSTGPETLGAAATALDAFTFSCPAGTASARANVQDTAPIVNPAARMRVTLTKLALVPPAAPQAQDLPLAPPSSTVTVVGGQGSYRAMFLKTAAGAESYEGNITCNNSAGAPIPGVPVLPANPQQNQ